MREINSVDELHSILMGIALEFHNICIKYNIPYYMLGGTMLGAVRHKGFIPWDDDMDFGVPREYYAKLKCILQDELSPHYCVNTIDNTEVPGLLTDIIKICDNRTIVKELYKENMKMPLGVNIDIFPLDTTNSDSYSKKNILIKCLMFIQAYRFLTISNRSFIKKIIALFIKVIFSPLKHTFIPRIINQLVRANEGTYIANFFGAWGEKEIVKREVMGGGTLYKFETFRFYGVQDPNSYLCRLYGDYMKLPPENKRHIHLTNIFWK